MTERIIYRRRLQIMGMADLKKIETSENGSDTATNPFQYGKAWLELEQDGRLIVSRSTGMWSMEELTAHLLRYREQLFRTRRAYGHARVLVDMQDATVQRSDVAAFLARDTPNLYREGDRVAMIVPSSLAKMQMRRILDSRFHQYFMSENAARNWLAGGETARGEAA